MKDKKGIELDTKQTVIAIIALFLFVGLIYYQYTALAEAKAEESKEQKMYTQVQSQVREYIQQKELFESNQQKAALYDQLMPKQADEPQLLTVIQHQVTISGMELTRINFAPRINQDGYTEMPFTLSIKGSYNNLIELTDQLRQSKRALRIDSINVNQEGQSDIRAEIKASAFYAQ
ncbi:type 4a pilus biogenesis protein PilO [Heliophilum fasciatum]|uniref:Tfp pilus assembly protein PilO n=1 Tax=Heliophilum fasciatum TaxID=35700 RepID=A0A4R2RSA5_9FIRM|nr:type 4a pilus biogenesis protein PilO [Heliophilum fasciatum]MCW2277272.1 type IV pilus assembly protein PilO [Heliophilum fasciatum]TCP67110.1 Tfp pilus assembly protein PilO [Heliophilum fasciatum]